MTRPGLVFLRSTALPVLLSSLLTTACAAAPQAVAPPPPPPASVSPEAPPPAKTLETKWRRNPPISTQLSAYEYVLPPEPVVSLLERESAPTAFVHAGARRVARLFEQKLVPTSQLERPQLGLAGLRIDVGNRMRAGTDLYTRLRYSALDYAADIHEYRPPDGSLIAELNFSPSGNKMLVTLAFTDHLEVGLLDARDHSFQTLSTGPLSAFWGAPCSFVNEDSLICAQPQNTGAPPPIEIGPNIRELMSGAAPVVPYSNLLRDANDDRLFEHYGAVQFALVPTDGTESRLLNVSGMITAAGVSPDSDFIYTSRISRPYPRQLPVSRFPQSLSIHSTASGEKIFEQAKASRDQVNVSLAPGPRMPSWDPTRPASLLFVERQLEANDSATDSLLEISAPFGGPAQNLAPGLRRVSAFAWSNKGNLFLTDSGSGSRTWVSYQLRDKLIELARGGESDVVGDPMQALRVNGESGAILETSGILHFKDETSLDTGAHPTLVAWTYATGKSDELWRSKDTEHAEVLAVLKHKKREYLIATESPSLPRHLVISREGQRHGLTQPAPPHPELFGMERRMMRYKRADGLPLSGMLSLPAGAQEGITTPLVLWIYPRDFADSDQASKSKEYPQRYIDPKGASRFLLLNQGYALFDCPMPIVGEVTSGRDDFLSQLISNAEAAIDHLVSIGIADRDRIAVMGHSYGAFAVANLLAHSKLFRTGIATSGAYNRTLTPFGFQRETRTFWQNTEAYVNMSPFFFADNIEGSLLLVHGEADDNAGTPILQSERFYAALVGNGVRTRFVSFPYEGHHLRGRDAVLHTAAEMIHWLDRELRSPN